MGKQFLASCDTTILNVITLLAVIVELSMIEVLVTVELLLLTVLLLVAVCAPNAGPAIARKIAEEIRVDFILYFFKIVDMGVPLSFFVRLE